MKKTTKILITALCIPFLFVSSILGWMAIQGEGYNPIDPLIDTKLSANFSEEKFNTIQVGNNLQDVIELLGEPLYRQELKNNIDLWYYSQDAKCEWGDFAWIAYCIHFDENCKVLKAYDFVGYD
jgi:outer membrane protein assembly factor BamE (lipoprotein component of BamABCDE complex)